MRKSIALAAAAATVSLFVSTSAQATTGTWVGPTNSTWSTGTAWQGGTIPNAVGDVAQYGGTSSQIAKNDIANVTVGTLKVFGTSNVSMQFTPNQNIIMNQDGAGPLRAQWINDIQLAGAGTNPALFLNNPDATFSGAFILQDDLLVSNTSNSTRTSGAIQIRGPIGGSGTITIENVSNNIGVGQIALTNPQSNLGANAFAGSWNINKGAVTFTRGDIFSPNPGNFVTIGSAGGGDVTLAAIGNGLGNIENNFVVAANTGGTSIFAANALNAGNPSTANIQIKSTNTNAAFVTLNGDISFDNRNTAGSIFIIGDPIQGVGKLTKIGAGPMEITHTGTYTGGTVVNAGSLKVRHADAFNNGFGFYAATDGTLGYGDVTVNNTATFLQIDTLLSAINVIADAATVSLAGGGNAGSPDLGYMQLDTGINETVGALALGGAFQIPGTYGSTASTATFQNDEYFSGPGILTVLRNPDFNGDQFNVNAADYVSWRKNDGTDAGYQSFRHNFNFPISPAGSSLEGASVPEPGTLLLTVASLALACASQRRRLTNR
jgi:autotransporter-associated beta strand protein